MSTKLFFFLQNIWVQTTGSDPRSYCPPALHGYNLPWLPSQIHTNCIVVLMYSAMPNDGHCTIIPLFVTANNDTIFNVTQHNIFLTHCKKHLWLRQSACGKVNGAFGPAMFLLLYPAPYADISELSSDDLKKLWLFGKKPIVVPSRVLIL